MKISREVNGEKLEFELTRTELMMAFEEYQHNSDVEDILYMKDFYDDPEDFFEVFGITHEQLDKIADQCADRYRKYIGESSIECWSDYAVDAIRNTVRLLTEDIGDDVVEPSDDQLEMGFDPYLGCYTEDC